MNDGIQIKTTTENSHATLIHLSDRLRELGLLHCVEHQFDEAAHALTVRLNPADFLRLTPGHDTIDLNKRQALPQNDWQKTIAFETWVAWLSAPILQRFDSWDDLRSAERMRAHLSHNARRTSMNFRTEEATRPESHWIYQSETGFILQPHADLVESLIMATQPDVSGVVYAFSCYRATEYVLLLSIAQEAKTHNPVLYEQLQNRWRKKAISSRQFHESFLHEMGTQEEPLPMTWYVPGDRVWFKNPDEASSDATGYEGSWVIYIGQGLFCNFWNHRQPYTLNRKCIEVYHWRDGYALNQAGVASVNEEVVHALTDQTMANPMQLDRILGLMKRYRDPSGVYADGGCIDSTREIPRKIMPCNCEVTLPPLV